MAEHKWRSPKSWLLDFLSRPTTDVFQEATVLVQQLDNGTIQDLYQDEMDKDDYFEQGSVDTEEDSEEMKLIKEGIEAFRK